MEIKTRTVESIPRDSHTLSMFVITYHPRDYPTKVVVREHASRPGEVLVLAHPMAIVDTVAQARASIPAGLFRLPRSSNDDPVILETWV